MASTPWKTCLLWVVGSLLFATPTRAQTTSVVTSPDPAIRELAPGLEIQIGMAGAWKLGHPCSIRLAIPDQFSDATHLEVDSVDGDGVTVTYRTEVADAATWVSLLVRIGREQGYLTVRLLQDDQVLVEREVDPSALGTRLSSSQPLLLSIGSKMGVDALALLTSGGDANLSTFVVDSAEELPWDTDGLAACDVLVISTRDLALLHSFSPQQWSAIDGWIRSGGGCIISLGPSAAELSSLEPLQQLIPGRFTGEGIVSNPGPLESLVVTDAPLKSFPATLTEMNAGVEIVLSLTDNTSRRFPWWSTYAHGHGTVRLIASDLDYDSLANWKDRRLLWERLLEPYFSRAMIEAPEKEVALAQASSYLGYSDLIGQLRATLDQFRSVKVVSFGQISAILIATLLLIGPIDYLVSVKWLGRPQFSWFFAGGSLAMISTGLLWTFASLRPDTVAINSAEIIDVDTSTQQIQGHLWFHVYSGKAQTFDVSATTVAGQRLQLDWQGLPGSGLGGLTSQLNVDRGMPSYSIVRQAEAGSRITAVGIPSGGTKSFVGHWTSDLSSSQLAAGADAVQLQELPGVDHLQGYFTNPLAIDLKDATLFYHDWYYILNSRITAGERVVITPNEIPKDLSRRHNRQRNVDGTISITRWDPASRDELDQLLELMMFFKASSGVNYASLSHRYQPRIDQSNLMNTDRAILIGRIDKSPVQIDVTSPADNNKLNVEPEGQRAWCRLILPVQRRP